MSQAVDFWWGFMCVVSAVNIGALAWSARAMRRRQDQMSCATYAARRLQLLLSGAYVLGCAYRSVLPVFDIQRICLVDGWYSSVMVGRTVATIAELCFAAQWALLMSEVAQAHGSVRTRCAAASVFPMILVAEACSWYAVLTTSNLGHVLEESLWGAAALIWVLGMSSLASGGERHHRPLWLGLCVAGLAYVAYMFLVDVPMYWARWLADEAQGRIYLNLDQGLTDATAHWVVSHQWQVWRTEVVWMTAYFSVAVWLSMGLVHLPEVRKHARRAALEWRSDSHMLQP